MHAQVRAALLDSPYTLKVWTQHVNLTQRVILTHGSLCWHQCIPYITHTPYTGGERVQKLQSLLASHLCRSSKCQWGIRFSLQDWTARERASREKVGDQCQVHLTE